MDFPYGKSDHPFPARAPFEGLQPGGPGGARAPLALEIFKRGKESERMGKGKGK